MNDAWLLELLPARGAPLLRELRFGVGVGHVYMRLKMASTLIGLRRHVLGCSEAACEARWDCVHVSVGQELGRICTGLGGFHVKVGQFFATRPDLVPPQWCRELSILCDAVEPVPGGQCRALAEAELGTSFLAWDDVPLGSASVAQVHAARMRFRTRRGRQASRAVAVKVRRPETRFFERDLRSVRTASGLLQRFEVDFDLLSAIDELRGRVAIELDFRNEYHNLRTAGAALRHATRGAVAVCGTGTSPALACFRCCAFDSTTNSPPESKRPRAEKGSPQKRGATACGGAARYACSCVLYSSSLGSRSLFHGLFALGGNVS